MAGAGRFRELLRKYGKVGLGVHLSISAASVTGRYVAIRNNIDVPALLEKVGMPAAYFSSKTTLNENSSTAGATLQDGLVIEDDHGLKKRNRTAELAAFGGGALALAFLLNKALIPVRVPITIALTPPVARFLRSRQIISNCL